jgi:signal transduction histidine kinase/ActR/RegA family two-component response regulator
MPRIRPGIQTQRRPSSRLPTGRLIVLFVLLSAVPLALLAFFSIRLASGAVTDEVKGRVRSTAAVSAVAVQKELQGVSQVVDAYARRPSLVGALGGGDPARYRPDQVGRALKELEETRPGVTSAAIADPAGRLLAVVPATPSIVGKNFSYRDWYKGVTATGGPYVAEAVVSQASGHPRIVAVASLVRANGRVVAILVVGYSLQTIQRFVDRFASSQSVELSVTDQSGVIVASPGASGNLLVSRRTDPLVAAALRGDSGVASRKDTTGRRVLAGYAPIGGLGWTVTASVPKGSALAAVGRLRSTVLTIVGVIGLGLLAGLVLLGRTLRGRRRAEDAAERSRAETEQAKLEAERAREQAERANGAKSEFLSRMSHELRTPLNAVLGFGQLLELEPLEPEAGKSVSQILKAGRHLLELINEVLDISRIEAGRMAVSLEAVAVQETVEEALELIRPLAAEKNVTVMREQGTGSGYVRADRQRLKQVLLNLLSNAVKYNHEGGSVWVRVEGDQERTRIEISDTGRGIPPEQLDRLFTPFERLDAEQLGIEGTGLGLALSRGLTDAMGATLSVESAPGQGSTFRIELQAAEHQLDAPAHPDESVRVVVAAGPGRPHSTLVYIEDNLPNLRLIEQVLTRRPEIKLISAMQGSLGLELVREHRPDLVLLDLHLPDLSGEEVLARLQADPSTAGIPVVMLSADATPGQVERFEAQGASAYLTKPLDVRKFLDLLDRRLGATAVGV